MVKVEVVGRPLSLRPRGPMFQVGERFSLDDTNPEHASYIRRGWVRLVPVAPFLCSKKKSVIDPPADKMIRRSKTKRKGRRA
jgi:hypothetical protein